MVLDHDIVECESVKTESVQSMNVVPDLPDINQVRAELNILGGSDSPPADFIMPTDYYPSTLDIHQPPLLITQACHH